MPAFGHSRGAWAAAAGLMRAAVLTEAATIAAATTRAKLRIVVPFMTVGRALGGAVAVVSAT